MARSPEKNRETLGSHQESPVAIDNSINMSEGLQEAINTMGNVAEGSERAKDTYTGSSGRSTNSGKKKQKKTAHQIRVERILQKAPPPREMIRQIHREIKREVRMLERQAFKESKKSGKVDYNKVNNTIRKVRELRGIVKTLLRAPLDGIKTLWLKFVHGIM